MPTEKKKQIIDSLEQTFAQSNSGIMTDYRGTQDLGCGRFAPQAQRSRG